MEAFAISGGRTGSGGVSSGSVFFIPWLHLCSYGGGEIDTLVRDEAPTVVLDSVRQEQRRGLSI